MLNLILTVIFLHFRLEAKLTLEKLKENLGKLVDDVEHHENSTSPEQETLIKDILLQPELLIGRRIKHRFQIDGELVWYEGVVQQLNFVTNEFQVAYEGEEDLSWFPLLDDIRSGDLLLIRNFLNVWFYAL